MAAKKNWYDDETEVVEDEPPGGLGRADDITVDGVDRPRGVVLGPPCDGSQRLLVAMSVYARGGHRSQSLR